VSTRRPAARRPLQPPAAHRPAAAHPPPAPRRPAAAHPPPAPRRPPAAFLPAAAFLLAAGCGADTGPGDPFVVSDSAGIRIVENVAVEGWDEDEAWRVAEPAFLRIGEVEGAPEVQLYQVEDARRLSDGRIVIANRATHELRFFTPDGRFERSVGREGEAPGEFLYLEALDVLPGDTILTVDRRQRRLTWFDSEGHAIRTAPFVHEEGPGWGMRARFEGAFGDGTFLMTALPGPGTPSPGVHRQQAPLRRVGPDGRVRAELGEPDFRDWYVDGVSQARGNLPYGPLLTVVVGDGGFYTGWGESYDLRFHRPDGTLERIVRRATASEPVTPGHFDRLLDVATAELEARGRAVSPALSAEMREITTVGEYVPPFSGARVDVEGNLWVLRYDPRNLEIFLPMPGEGWGTMQWDIFSREGIFQGSLRTPTGLRITEIGSDWLLGVATDPLGIETIRMYRLEKP
jgi:hypothetical protein